MDSVFLLGDRDRAAFLQHMMRSFPCLHICLWSHLPQPSNCLLAMDGLYRETSSQNPSSSSRSLARRLFDAYRESVSYVDTGRIPGFAFKNNLPYMELKFHDLQRMASHDVQLQFYQEAGIKTVVFMGCAAGEIELGISNDHPPVDLEKEMKNLFPADFSRQASLSGGGADINIPNHPPSSSSSSLRSLSVDSSEYSYSPLLFNTEPNLQEALLEDPLIRSVPLSTPPLLTAEMEDAAMTKAMLAVLTSPSTNYNSNNSPTAFGRYNLQRTAMAPVPGARRKQNMFKRSVLFFRNLNMRRIQDSQATAAAQGGNRPTTTQMHHMISERRRREKLNDSFQVLRTLLPSGTKKDKASMLSSTTEYLSSLKLQVAELNKRNQTLETQLTMAQRSSRPCREDDQTVGGFSSVDERTSVEVVPVSSSSPSTSEGSLDMIVRVRSLGESNSMLELVIRILDLLKQHRSIVSLSSVDSNTTMSESSIPVHQIAMRLKIEGDGFDESALGAAVRRLVDDNNPK